MERRCALVSWERLDPDFSIIQDFSIIHFLMTQYESKLYSVQNRNIKQQFGDMMIYDGWALGEFSLISWQNELGGLFGSPGLMGLVSVWTFDLLPRRKKTRGTRAAPWCPSGQVCPLVVLLLYGRAQLGVRVQGCRWTWAPCGRLSHRFSPDNIHIKACSFTPNLKCQNNQIAHVSFSAQF